MLSERKTPGDYPQELLNLFDEYVHGDIDRRGFLDRAQKFATTALSALAILQSLQHNYVWAQQIAKDDPRIKATHVTIDSPQGNGKIECYAARPNNSERRPGIIVIHENRGRNPYIEDVTRRLAVANFNAIAPDGLTSVGGYPGDEEKGVQLFGTVDKAKMTEDFIAVARALKARPDCTGKIGAVGFCFGGGRVNTLAVRMGAYINAGAAFYGAQPQAADVAKIKAPLMLHYASQDQRITSGWPKYEEALKANHVPYEAFVYEGAQHGFHNDTTPRYDEKAAKLTWQRTLDFFNKYLRG
jgi:carboxymethylenebutenolidase